ncbi:MAG TPA: YqaJ viral recombinase family protein [Casimicrobiaceae bacterium]|nr:YqaJ viral recombinase family protein [Casimicrobiaceae bacterium]
MGLTDAQLTFRRSGIGGSEIAAVVGVNPYMKPIDVWLAKKGLAEVTHNEKMEWGLRLEPAALAKYGEQKGVEVLHPREYFPESVDGTVRHPTHKFAIATPDGIVKTPRRVQVKCAFDFGALAWGESGDAEGVPEHVIVQSTWEGLVTGIHDADIVALINGYDFRVYPVAWDADLAGMLLEQAERFWKENVEGNVQPSGASDTLTKYLRDRYSKTTGKVLPPPVGLYELAKQYDAARAACEAAEERKESLGNEIRKLIGENDGFEGPGIKATWKWQNGQPAYKAIAEELAGAAGIPTAIRAKHTGRKRVLNVKVEG